MYLLNEFDDLELKLTLGSEEITIKPISPLNFGNF